MTISRKEWNNYIKRLGKLSEEVGKKVKDYIEREGLEDIDELITYSYNLATKYGEGAAALSAQMYDVIAEMEGKVLPEAVMAETASYGDVAKAVHGTLKTSQNPEEIGGAVSRLVKRAGADTTLNNAIRDRAEFAWIPSGETCAFCLTLASRGWQPISKNALKDGHAEHIHSNCDCQYAVRFTHNMDVAGYDPERYQKMYYNADGNTDEEKINSMRRDFYKKNREEILAQKASAEEKRKELDSSSAEEDF